MNPTVSSVIESTSTQSLDFTVVTCVIAYKGKFLALQRARKDGQYGMWGIPGGKLDEAELPPQGLSREILEETQLDITPSSFQELSKAYITNPYDGHYCVYLFFINLTKPPQITINQEEHSDYRWVTIEEFESLNLLVSQGQAFNLIKNQLPALLSAK